MTKESGLNWVWKEMKVKGADFGGGSLPGGDESDKDHQGLSYLSAFAPAVLSLGVPFPAASAGPSLSIYMAASISSIVLYINYHLPTHHIVDGSMAAACPQTTK